MISFNNDYSETAHPRILSAIQNCNNEQNVGYGLDQHCLRTETLIQKLIGCPSAKIHFLTGGTQANLTVISSLLKPYEAVISPTTGHIAVHETGAIEATGHKVITVMSKNGKLSVQGVEDALALHSDEHMVKPKMVYLTNATEIGSIYTLQELKDLSNCCKKHHLILFLDGARLGSALAAKDNDITLKDYAQYCDIFYLGGTKNGLLFGEALIFTNPLYQEDFRYSMKQKGGLLAKGFLLGIQFYELLKDGLFLQLALHANTMADTIQSKLLEWNTDFLLKTSTNQIFPILSNKMIKELQKKYHFSIWEKIDDSKSAIRLVTSWATSEDNVNHFLNDFQKLIKE